jgi:hypothetical protein
MTRRGICRHSGAGKKAPSALDEAAAIQGFSFSLRATDMASMPKLMCRAHRQLFGIRGRED